MHTRIQKTAYSLTRCPDRSTTRQASGPGLVQEKLHFHRSGQLLLSRTWYSQNNGGQQGQLGYPFALVFNFLRTRMNLAACGD